MIWFFLAGWIAGAVAMLMVLNWWAKEHIVSIEEAKEEDGPSGASTDADSDQHGTGCD